MTVSDTHARALEAILQLASDVATEETMADQCGELRAIAEASGLILGPAMRNIANGHRIRAMDLRCRAAVLTNEHLEAFKDHYT